ncbi:MAG: hypothetical protein AB7N76_12480 [Planctomycetota bacterium]
MSDDLEFSTHAPGSSLPPGRPAGKPPKPPAGAPAPTGPKKRYGPPRAPTPERPAGPRERLIAGKRRASGEHAHAAAGPGPQPQPAGPQPAGPQPAGPQPAGPQPAGPPPGPSPRPGRRDTPMRRERGGMTQRLALRGRRATLRLVASTQRFGATAGPTAFKRTLSAHRDARQKRKQRRAERAELSAIRIRKAENDAARLEAHAAAAVVSPSAGAAAAHPAAFPYGAPDPSFLLEVPGALLGMLAPGNLLAALAITLVGGFALTLAHFVPVLGPLACLLVGARLLALRLHHVSEVSNHRDVPGWPDWEETWASLAIYLGAAALFLPALVLGVLAWGPGAWDRADPGSIPSRAAAFFQPSAPARQVAQVAADAAEAYKNQVWSAQDAVQAERTALGLEESEENARRRAQSERALAALRQMGEGEPNAPAEPAPVERRPWREVLRERSAEARARLAGLVVPPPDASRGAVGARVALGLGLLLFPMGLLAGARLRTAYAPLHLPLLLVSILQTPLSYLLCALVFVAQDALLLGAAWVLPATLDAALGSASGILLGQVLLMLVGSLLCAGSGALLGRFYRARQADLGW